MDTGNYMANQISNQIEASQHYYEDFCNELEIDISKFITDCGYTCTAIDIFTEYREKYSKGFYVSHACKKVIKKFEDKLKLVYGIQ